MEQTCQFCAKKFTTEWVTSVIWCTDCLVLNPMEWLDLNLKSKQKYSNYSYLVTFTRNPNSRYDREQWLYRVDKEMNRKSFSEVNAVLEHIEENIHAHVIVQSNKPFTKNLFKVFNRDYGYVDVRRINTDNGVRSYIEKDMPNGQEAQEKEDFLKYYLDKL